MNFHKDLKFGLEAEIEFINRFPGKMQQLGGQGSDIQLIVSGNQIQLKTDRRAFSDTGNLFIERYSHKDRKTSGGPWRAAEDNSKYFVYLFKKCGTFKTYDVVALITWLEKNAESLKKHNVWTSNSMGYIVPASELEILELDFNTLE